MIIDLRSDTVTKPSEEMLATMMNAPVGDDVFGDDPSVNELEELAAKMFGMKAAIFCPSGTMTNQLAIKLHTNAPGEVICDELSHVYKYEGGGIGFNSGLATKLVKGTNGQINVDLIKAAINPDDIHFPESQLVSVENTCNKGGGTVYELQNLIDMSRFCKENGIKYHLDGARIFNAIVSADYSPVDLGKLFDTISICLSKGLGAPVGSLLLGNKSDIKKARRLRKIFGGGMRQAGFIASAGSYALKNNIDRMVEDHRRAKFLANELSPISYIKKTWPVYTNIVVFEIVDSMDMSILIDQLNKRNVKVAAFGPQQIRLVTHLDITDQMIDEAVSVFKRLAK